MMEKQEKKDDGGARKRGGKARQMKTPFMDFYYNKRLYYNKNGQTIDQGTVEVADVNDYYK